MRLSEYNAKQIHNWKCKQAWNVFNQMNRYFWIFLKVFEFWKNLNWHYVNYVSTEVKRSHYLHFALVSISEVVWVLDRMFRSCTHCLWEFPVLIQHGHLTMTPWRNGSASDSRSEGCVFESRRGHNLFSLIIFFAKKLFASNEDWTHDLWFTRPTLCHWAIEALHELNEHSWNFLSILWSC